MTTKLSFLNDKLHFWKKTKLLFGHSSCPFWTTLCLHDWQPKHIYALFERWPSVNFLSDKLVALFDMLSLLGDIPLAHLNKMLIILVLSFDWSWQLNNNKDTLSNDNQLDFLNSALLNQVTLFEQHPNSNFGHSSFPFLIFWLPLWMTTKFPLLNTIKLAFINDNQMALFKSQPNGSF